MGAGTSSGVKRSSQKKPPSASQWLLLGAGGCGKSTICKQMVATSRGYTDEERRTYTDMVYNAIRTSVSAVVRELDETVQLDENVEKCLETFETEGMSSQLVSTDSPSWTPNLECMKQIWQSGGMGECKKKALERGGYEQRLFHNNCDYYLEDSVFQRLSNPSYVPSNDDIAHCRVVTTTATDVPILLNGSQTELVLRDVGGQIYRRNEWKTAFIGVNVVLYVVALDSYASKDGQGVNDMGSSLELAKQLVVCEELKSVPFVIIFNKEDLFREMIQTTPMNGVPNFTPTAPQSDADACLEEFEAWFLRELIEARRGAENAKGIEGMEALKRYRTCALDAKLTSNVVTNACNGILEMSLKKSFN